MFVHTSHILCYPVTRILKLHWTCRLLQARSTR